MAILYIIFVVFKHGMLEKWFPNNFIWRTYKVLILFVMTAFLLSYSSLICCVWLCVMQYCHFSTFSYLEAEPHKCSFCQRAAAPAQTGCRSSRCSHHYLRGSNGCPQFSLCHSAGSSLRRRRAGCPCCDCDGTRRTELLCLLKGHSVRSPAGPNRWACPPRRSRAKFWVWKLELTEIKVSLSGDSVDDGHRCFFKPYYLESHSK